MAPWVEVPATEPNDLGLIHDPTVKEGADSHKLFPDL